MDNQLTNENSGSELTFESARDQIEEDEQESEEEKESKIFEVQSSMLCNSSDHSTKKQRFKGLLRPKTWPNPFVQGRYERIETIFCS